MAPYHSQCSQTTAPVRRLIGEIIFGYVSGRWGAFHHFAGQRLIGLDAQGRTRPVRQALALVQTRLPNLSLLSARDQRRPACSFAPARTPQMNEVLFTRPTTVPALACEGMRPSTSVR